MAKKRKKEKAEKQEYEFKPPEFDEKEFLKKELRDTKTVMLTVGYAGFFGIVAGVLTDISDELVFVGLALLFGGIFSLKYFYPMVKVDVSAFQRKNWAGNFMWFFMTFLAVWVLIINFPFADHASPTVTGVKVWVTTDTNVTSLEYEYVDSVGSYLWTENWGALVEDVIYASASCTVNITAKVADNGELTSVRIAVNGGDYAMTPEGNHRFGYNLTGDEIDASSLSFTITATDDAGHVKMLTPLAIPVRS